MTTVTLRPSTPDDEQLHRAAFSAARPEIAVLGSELVTQQLAAQSAHYAQAFPDLETWVVEVDGEPAGRLLVDDAEVVRVVDVALLTSYQGRGVGTAVLSQVIDRAGLRPVELSVAVDNPAGRLYQRLGFEVVEDLGVHVGMRRTQPKAAS